MNSEEYSPLAIVFAVFGAVLLIASIYVLSVDEDTLFLALIFGAITLLVASATEQMANLRHIRIERYLRARD